MPKCTHRGCEQDFDDAANGPQACHFHSGKPVFHEGLKGWSCCDKRVTSFDAFLQIPGCCTGAHSVAPIDSVTFSSTTDDSGEACLPNQVEPPATGLARSMDNVSLQTTTTTRAQPLAGSQPSASATSKKAIEEEEKEDPADAVIPPGTICKHRGCGYEYGSDVVSRGSAASPEAACQYHPGAPIFHEGSKGWSCCKRRVLEFEEFLKIKGCKSGKHRFLDASTTNGQSVASNQGTATNGGTDQLQKVDCRHDWYQTQSQVIMSIFAKNIDKAKSSITIGNQKIKAHLVLPNNRVYHEEIPLFLPIDPAASSYEVLSTKVELTLKKTSGVSWASLLPSENFTSWTTFGQGDSPLSLNHKSA
ncbi:hypothetical protein H4R34_000571 [Dimargaris verticillata]|uniref:HSP20-like chaperone n=1 Tax=Dimargaris verticillata TaxID=2761393 RepID=A0A9W8EEL7_9FUNG|nr:hypothetical protein H4R34_000571 [Dimargaris verticillata]